MTKLFSELGFHGVSTREIAGATRATLPSIQHHFRSKEGLYQAVLLEIAAEMREKLAPASKGPSVFSLEKMRRVSNS